MPIKQGASSQLSRSLLIILSVFILLHLLLLLFYLSTYKQSYQQREYQALDIGNTALLQLILSARQTEEHSRWEEDIKQLELARLRLHGSQVHISITDMPLWFWQYDQSTPIVELFTKEAKNFSFSYQLDDEQWLNFSLAPTLNIVQAILLLLILDSFALAMILFYWWSVARFAIPLENFRDSAEKLGVNVNAKLAQVKGPPIVQEMANAMQQLQERIQNLLNTRNQTLAAISHDLRTPITRLKLRTQFIDDEEAQQKILQDLNDMEVMINNILSYAREDLLLKEGRKKFDFVALVSALCDDYADLNYAVSFDSDLSKLAYQGKMVAIKRALDNLLNNALQRANAVAVRVDLIEKSLVLTITDDGPGIPEEQIAQVMQAFYRLHDQKHSGYGLGLAIANDIIVSHQGKITLRNVKPHGLKVSIRLPIINE